MKFAHKNIAAFIYLLENNPELFSLQDRQTLADKIPEDIEEISESLLAWCEERSEINDALRRLRRTLPDDERQSKGPGGIFPNRETQAEDNKNLRETILNALRQSSPPETPKTTTSND
jgi:hypothetical protein